MPFSTKLICFYELKLEFVAVVMNTLLTKLLLLAVSACLVPRGVRSQCTDATRPVLCSLDVLHQAIHVTPGVNFVLDLHFSSFLYPHNELIALFNTTYNFCGERSYSDGYSCRYKKIQPVQETIGNNFTVIVECADEPGVLGVQSGTAILRFRMIDFTNSAPNTTCDAEIDVEWMQTRKWLCFLILETVLHKYPCLALQPMCLNTH